MSAVATSPAEVIASGRAVLGIELGSTRIKACLIGSDAEVLATGSYEWENVYAEKLWTYSLDAVWWGLQAAYAELVDNVRQQFGVTPERYAAIGVLGDDARPLAHQNHSSGTSSESDRVSLKV